MSSRMQSNCQILIFEIAWELVKDHFGQTTFKITTRTFTHSQFEYKSFLVTIFAAIWDQFKRLQYFEINSNVYNNLRSIQTFTIKLFVDGGQLVIVVRRWCSQVSIDVTRCYTCNYCCVWFNIYETQKADLLCLPGLELLPNATNQNLIDALKHLDQPDTSTEVYPSSS